MSVKPSQSSDLTRRVQFHYDFLAPFYYLLWGEHVHHGYWEDDADTTPPKAAQERLVDKLYTFAGRPSTDLRLLDLGCGYGSGTLWLSRHAAIRRALGMTISPLQQAIAQTRIARAGLGDRVQIRLADAQEPWPLDDGDINLLWCCEMTEHLRDRAFWAREAFRVLEPGGTLVLATWLKGDNLNVEQSELAEKVARDTVGYPFSTRGDFDGFLADAGFTDIRSEVITPHVVRTYDIADKIQALPFPRWVAHTVGGDIAMYTKSFAHQASAYRTGAMEYAFFTARK